MTSTCKVEVFIALDGFDFKFKKELGIENVNNGLSHSMLRN